MHSSSPPMGRARPFPGRSWNGCTRGRTLIYGTEDGLGILNSPSSLPVSSPAGRTLPLQPIPPVFSNRFIYCHLCFEPPLMLSLSIRVTLFAVLPVSSLSFPVVRSAHRSLDHLETSSTFPSTSTFITASPYPVAPDVELYARGANSS